MHGMLAPTPNEIRNAQIHNDDDYRRRMLDLCGNPDPAARYRFTAAVVVESRRFAAGREIRGTDVPFDSLCSLVRMKQVELVDQAAAASPAIVAEPGKPAATKAARPAKKPMPKTATKKTKR